MAHTKAPPRLKHEHICSPALYARCLTKLHTHSHTHTLNHVPIGRYNSILGKVRGCALLAIIPIDATACIDLSVPPRRSDHKQCDHDDYIWGRGERGGLCSCCSGGLSVPAVVVDWSPCAVASPDTRFAQLVCDAFKVHTLGLWVVLVVQLDRPGSLFDTCVERVYAPQHDFEWIWLLYTRMGSYIDEAILIQNIWSRLETFWTH